MSSGPKKAARQIAGLDFIRFASALIVMFHHLGWRVWGSDYAVGMNYHYLGPLGTRGFIGVQIFFVLSGFLIAYSAQNATPRAFLVSRVVRLLPAAWICSTFTILVVCITGHGQMRLGHSSFSQGLSGRWLNSLILFPLGPWVDGSYWTLGIECGFYLQIYLLLLWHRFRLIAKWMTLVGLLSTTSLAVLTWVYRNDIQTKNLVRFADAVADKQWAGDLLLHHGCLFALGVLLWLVLLDRATSKRIIALCLMLPGVWLDIQWRIGWDGHWLVPVGVWSLAMVGIVVSVLCRQQIHSLLGERGMKLARRLGVITYPLYLIHQVAGYALLATLKPYLPDIFNLVVVYFGMIVVAYAMNRFLEEPLQRAFQAAMPLARRPLPEPAATEP